MTINPTFFNTLLLGGVLLCNGCAKGNQWYVTRDLCPEGSFTTNCEGPNMDKEGNLYVVNYQKDGTIGWFKSGHAPALWLELPAGSTANSIQFDSKGMMLLADFTGHNVLKVDPTTRAVTVLCHDGRFNQPNDLCVTREDIIYASDPNWGDGTGQIWRVTPDGKAMRAVTNLGTTNGITLSPDEKILYVNESVQQRIWAFDINPQGVLVNKRLFVQFYDFGLDGMKCDREGNLYVARWGKGTIAVYSPAHELLREIPVKGAKVSNLAFGGKDGKTVYVTLQDRKCVSRFRNPIAGKGW